MAQRNIGALLVKDVQPGVLAGIITDRDLIQRVLGEWLDPATTTVESVMTASNIAMIYEDANLMNAERVFIDRCVRRLVVLRRADNAVAGILSIDDLAIKGHHARAGEALRASAAFASEKSEPTTSQKVASASSITTTSNIRSSLASVTRSEYVISDLMNADIEWIRDSDCCRKAVIRMLLRSVGCLPVCQAGPGGKLLGIVTDRDLVVRLIATNRNPDTTLVREVMSTDVACCFADDNLADAQRLMQSKRVRRLPVLLRSSNAMVGILSIDDIALQASASRAGSVLSFGSSQA
jgi:CBS domain-containing protein